MCKTLVQTHAHFRFDGPILDIVCIFGAVLDAVRINGASLEEV